MAMAEGHVHGWIGRAAKFAAYAFLLVATLALAANFASPYPMDFISYWAAGVLVLDGNPLGSYDIALHREIELRAAHVEGAMPFPYPPPFLLVVAPFGLLPFATAALCWVAITFLFYILCMRAFAPRAGWVAAAYPPVLTTAVIGQNAFLLGGLMAGGLALLARRPFLAGIVLGGLVVKPQLGVVLPFVLLAAREWRAIAGAALSSMGLLALGAAAFGIHAYAAWLEQAPTFAAVMTENLSGWHKMASVYAALRLAGAGHALALSLHIAVAVGAVGAACLVWHRVRDIGARAGSLAAATALISPYLYGYDTLILVLPFIWLAQFPRDRAALAAIWLISLAGFLQNWVAALPVNPTPLAAIWLLLLVYRRATGGEADDFSASASEAVALPGRAGRG